ncbi:hypothetical protein MGSAQ_002330 [marine sediment metagenome]|uniref:Uncharacterized protein n=1 Tax=marine sediment metagenome TaxID=412755 RepID=A0A1B6NRT2_9ZZZZ
MRKLEKLEKLEKLGAFQTVLLFLFISLVRLLLKVHLICT